MGEIRFQEERRFIPQSIPQARGLEALVIRLGIAPDRKSAQLALIVGAILLFVGAFFIIRDGVRSPDRTFNIGNDPILRNR